MSELFMLLVRQQELFIKPNYVHSPKYAGNGKHEFVQMTPLAIFFMILTF